MSRREPTNLANDDDAALAYYAKLDILLKPIIDQVIIMIKMIVIMIIIRTIVIILMIMTIMITNSFYYLVFSRTHTICSNASFVTER